MELIKKWFRSWEEQREKDKELSRRQEAAIAALSGGDIHPRARERIERENALGKKFFSSDLTVREFLLCREAGLETIGQVMGSCFYNVSLIGAIGGTLGLTQSSYQSDHYYSSFGSLQQSNGELQAITEAQLKARRLCVDRMLLEAHLMGAHGVVGVRVKATNFNWTTRMTEFTAMGTAVRVPGLDNRGKVFTSDLNGQEFWQLYKAGYTPVELSFGVCSYYVRCDRATRRLIDPTAFDVLLGGSTWNNQEIEPFSQGFYDARHMAMNRLLADGQAVHADGVVSMEVDYTMQTVEYEVSSLRYHDMVLHFIATGTSIVHDHERQPVLDHKKPQINISLSGSKLSSISYGTPSYGGESGGTLEGQISGEDYEDELDDLE